MSLPELCDVCKYKHPDTDTINFSALRCSNQKTTHPAISCSNPCEGNSLIDPLPSSSVFIGPFPSSSAFNDDPFPTTAGPPDPSITGDIASASSRPCFLLPRRKLNARKATRHTAAMAPITTPAMAPEDNPEDDLEALGELDGLESGKEGEEVVASSFRQQMFLS